MVHEDDLLGVEELLGNQQGPTQHTDALHFEQDSAPQQDSAPHALMQGWLYPMQQPRAYRAMRCAERLQTAQQRDAI